MPDSTKLLYRRVPKDARINHDLWGETGELVIADADGSNPVVPGQAGEFPWASFSPSMKQIACLHKKDQAIRILDSGNKTLIKEMPSQEIFQQLFWSPDGKQLAGTANVVGRKWNVVSIDIADEKATVVCRFWTRSWASWFRNRTHGTDGSRMTA